MVKLPIFFNRNLLKIQKFAVITFHNFYANVPMLSCKSANFNIK